MEIALAGPETSLGTIAVVASLGIGAFVAAITLLVSVASLVVLSRKSTVALDVPSIGRSLRTVVVDARNGAGATSRRSRDTTSC